MWDMNRSGSWNGQPAYTFKNLCTEYFLSAGDDGKLKSSRGSAANNTHRWILQNSGSDYGLPRYTFQNVGTGYFAVSKVTDAVGDHLYVEAQSNGEENQLWVILTKANLEFQ